MLLMTLGRALPFPPSNMLSRAIGILSGKKEKIRNNKLQEQNAFISTINHEDGNNRKEGREMEGEREMVLELDSRRSELSFSRFTVD